MQSIFTLIPSFFFSSRRRHTRSKRDWSSDVCSSDLTEAAAGLIDFCIDRMYSHTQENEFVEVSYADGSKEVLHFSDFASGAMINNIVDRAKKSAITALLQTGQRGLRAEHFEAAIAEEYSEHDGLPNTTNPDEWARISGRKGERVTHLRMVHLDTTRGAPVVPNEAEISEVRPNSDLV